LGSCTPTYCLNGGICQQGDVGTSRYIICQCKAGWTGARCEKRLNYLFILSKKYSILFLEYFRCQSSGYFIDEYMKNQGKYFWCISYNNG